MPIKMLMPALSPTMKEGKIGRWIKKEGEEIRSGDIIAEIETDKATMEWEATEEGKLGKIIVGDGTEGVEVNRVIGILLEDGEGEKELEEALKEVGNEGNSKSVNREEKVQDVNNNLSNDSNKPSGETLDNNKLVSTHYSQESHGSANVVDAYADAPRRTLTVREALNEAMCEEMRKDQDIFLIGEEVAYYQGAYKVSQGMLDEFGPQRIVDTPITEYGFTGLGVGAAFSGLKPIVEYMTFNFALQAVDHILNSAAKGLYMSGGELKTPIVFRGLNGGGSRVAAQHSQCFASWYAHCPGLIVIAPYSAEDAKGLLKAAIRDPNPVIFLEHEVLYGKSFEMPDVDDLIIPIGQAKIEKSGKDVTIIGYSLSVERCLEASVELEKQGITAEVINLRTLRPLDVNNIIQSVKKTNRVVIVEEGWPYAGIASEIISLVVENAFDYLDAPAARVCGKDVPMPYAENLERMALPSVAEIIDAAKRVCYKK